LIPALEQEALRAAEELAEADVIRRHVILHPERFSPHERDSVVERAQNHGEARQRAEIAAESVRERLQFCLAVAGSLRAANDLAASMPAATAAAAPAVSAGQPAAPATPPGGA